MGASNVNDQIPLITKLTVLLKQLITVSYVGKFSKGKDWLPEIYHYKHRFQKSLKTYKTDKSQARRNAVIWETTSKLPFRWPQLTVELK